MKQVNSSKISASKGRRKRWIFAVASIVVFITGAALGTVLHGFFFQPSKQQVQDIAYGAAARYCFIHHEPSSCKDLRLTNVKFINYDTPDDDYWGTWVVELQVGQPHPYSYVIGVGLDRAGSVLYTNDGGMQKVN